MIRIGHFSDLHYSEKHLVEADRCFGFAIEQALARGIDMAVVSGDSTDHALDVHSPAVERMARRVLALADHCPVLMLQGTFSHEPPGTLSLFPLLASRHPVHVADRISQVVLTDDGTWRASKAWRFDALPAQSRVLVSCLPTLNKAHLAADVGPAEVGFAQGQELASLLAGCGHLNDMARQAGLPTIGVSHGTVSGCLTEHGVPMAGFDHEFTTGSLFAARAQAFLLGHIHRHQSWEKDGRVIAYAGSIGRFHHGEEGDKGFLLWEVGAATTRLELVATPARRTVDLVFDGLPDLEAVAAAVRERHLDGAHVRVRWTAGDEQRDAVDRAALRRALSAAADVQLEGRIVPVTRSRAAGISRCASLADKVRAWAEVTDTQPEPLLQRLAALASWTPSAIAADLLARPAGDPTGRSMGHSAEACASAGAATEPVDLFT